MLPRLLIANSPAESSISFAKWPWSIFSIGTGAILLSVGLGSTGIFPFCKKPRPAHFSTSASLSRIMASALPDQLLNAIFSWTAAVQGSVRLQGDDMTLIVLDYRG